MSLSSGTVGTTNINGGVTGGSAGTITGLSTTTNDSVLIGQNCATNDINGFSNTYVGNWAATNSTQGSGNVAVGFYAAPYISSDNNVIVGNNANIFSTGGGWATVVGAYASSTPYGVAMGYNSSTYLSGFNSYYGIAIGTNSQSLGQCSVSVGYNSYTDSDGSIAIGKGSKCLNADSGISIGVGAQSFVKSVSIGSNAVSQPGGVNINNRLMGYFATATATATYVLQARADALKIVGGGVLAFCSGAGGVSGSTQLDPAPQWTVGTSSDDLMFTSSSGAVVKLVDDFRPGLLDFTAQHRCIFRGGALAPPPPPHTGHRGGGGDFPPGYRGDLHTGLVVIATGKYKAASSGGTAPTADEAVPVVEFATDPMDPRVFGVLSGDPVGEYRFGHLVFQQRGGHDDEDEPFVVVNSAGEGGIWVSNENGAIRNGDLVITGSSIPGVAIRQPDDIVRSYTCAKITCDCDFYKDTPGPVVEFGKHGRMCLLGCVYKF